MVLLFQHGIIFQSWNLNSIVHGFFVMQRIGKFACEEIPCMELKFHDVIFRWVTCVNESCWSHETLCKCVNYHDASAASSLFGSSAASSAGASSFDSAASSAGASSAAGASATSSAGVSTTCSSTGVSTAADSEDILVCLFDTSS